MKKIKLVLIAVLFIGGGYFFINKSEFSTSKSENQYQYDLAILNKSFKRDLERSVILYKSFEKYFIGSESIPFVVALPTRDVDLFVKRFEDLKNNNEIKRLPRFLTEQEILSTCGEPDVSHDGNLVQQVVKLCFGSTRIAKNYLMIDSDNYFTKDFDPKILLKKAVSKTFAWKMPKKYIELDKKLIVHWFLDAALDPLVIRRMIDTGATLSAYQLRVLVKDFFGNKNPDIYAFVMSPFLFNSDALDRMKKLIDKKGGYKFALLIRLMPYEMQWYGEYMLQYENFIPMDPIFELINSPNECHPEDGGNRYGLVFQSIIYDYDSIANKYENTSLIYKRPAHCDKK